MKESVERLLEEDDFSLFVPGVQGAGFEVDMQKSLNENIEETRPIHGYCSTEGLDRQEEVVVAKGLDFSEFLNFGYFNDNHKQDTAAVLGYPRLAELHKGSRWYTAGNLLSGYPRADEIWDLAKSLRKSNAPRRLGFSIEGKVKERDNRNRILRAIVRHVAITNSPVNTECTWDIMAKAFAPMQEVERAATKALTTGYGRGVGGAALRKESVEGTRRMVRKDKLSFDEAVERLQRLRPQFSKSTCERIVRLAMQS